MPFTKVLKIKFQNFGKPFPKLFVKFNKDCVNQRQELLKGRQCNRFYSTGSQSQNSGQRLENKSLYQEKKDRIVCVEGINVNVREEGEGSQNVFLMPGLVGTIETDFAKLFEKMDESKFRLISWDPPGYGKSLPHDRIHDPDFYHKDALVAARLMEELGYKKYSILGWSNGGMTGYTLASEFPDRVTHLVMWGSHAIWDATSKQRCLKTLSSMENWSPDLLKTMIGIYGEEYFQAMLTNWDEATREFSRSGKDVVLRKRIKPVQCPTLAIHGLQDPVILIEHAHYFVKHMRNCMLRILPDAQHNLHLTHTDEFLSYVHRFLLGQLEDDDV